MRQPEDMHCSRCGATPGQACKTTGGNRTTMHRARVDAPTNEEVHKATKFACWKTGWECGARLMSTAQAQELANSYLQPQSFLDGWHDARTVTEIAQEKARQRILV